MPKYVASEKIFILFLCACEFDVIVAVFLFAHKKKKKSRGKDGFFLSIGFCRVLIVTASNSNDFMLQAVSCYARTSTQ